MLTETPTVSRPSYDGYQQTAAAILTPIKTGGDSSSTDISTSILANTTRKDYLHSLYSFVAAPSHVGEHKHRIITCHIKVGIILRKREKAPVHIWIRRMWTRPLRLNAWFIVTGRNSASLRHSKQLS